MATMKKFHAFPIKEDEDYIISDFCLDCLNLKNTRCSYSSKDVRVLRTTAKKNRSDIKRFYACSLTSYLNHHANNLIPVTGLKSSALLNSK